MKRLALENLLKYNDVQYRFYMIVYLHIIAHVSSGTLPQITLQDIFAGKDVVIQAHTGSGKTLAYSIPLLSRIDLSHAAIQAVVVVPTRELGLQVAAVLKQLAAPSPQRIMVMSVVEGSKNRRSPYIKQPIENLFCNCQCFVNCLCRAFVICHRECRQMLWAAAEPPHVVVGNPKALQKLVDMGKLRLNAVDMVVLDEVDACLIDPDTKMVRCAVYVRVHPSNLTAVLSIFLRNCTNYYQGTFPAPLPLQKNVSFCTQPLTLQSTSLVCRCLFCAA